MTSDCNSPAYTIYTFSDSRPFVITPQVPARHYHAARRKNVITPNPDDQLPAAQFSKFKISFSFIPSYPSYTYQPPCRSRSCHPARPARPAVPHPPSLSTGHITDRPDVLSSRGPSSSAKLIQIKIVAPLHYPHRTTPIAQQNVQQTYNQPPSQSSIHFPCPPLPHSFIHNLTPPARTLIHSPTPPPYFTRPRLPNPPRPSHPLNP